MEFDVKIQKTDVKIYDIKVSVDYDSLVEFCKNSFRGSYGDYLDEWCSDEDTGEIDETKSLFKNEKEYYQSFASEYIDEQDPDLLFTDNCQNHSEYQLESEECNLIQAEEIN